MSERNASWALILALAIGCNDKGPTDDSAPVDDSGATDSDGDGYTLDQDCDDQDAAINPDADEECDCIDNNCDGTVDEGVTTPSYADGDSDGFGD